MKSVSKLSIQKAIQEPKKFIKKKPQNNPWFEANLVIFGAWLMSLNAWSGQR